MQTDALQAYGCVEVAQEKVSSVQERPALQQLLARLRASDTLVFWKLGRLGRSLKDLVTLVTGFQDQGVHFVSLQDHLDTTTAQGRQGGDPKASRRKLFPKRKPLKRSTYSRTRTWPKLASCSASAALPFTAILPIWVFLRVAL